MTAVGPIVAAPGLPGGASAQINVTATGVIKAAAGILYRIIATTVGTGSLTLNDVTTVGGATTANTIVTIPVASITAGVPIYLEWPCGTGIVISAFPTGGVYSFSFS